MNWVNPVGEERLPTLLLLSKKSIFVTNMATCFGLTLSQLQTATFMHRDNYVTICAFIVVNEIPVL
jgi:hypothetical protein